MAEWGWLAKSDGACRQFGWALLVPIRIVFFVLFWLFGCDRDDHGFNDKQDANGLLTFLMGFAAVQGAGLIAVLQQQGAEGLGMPLTIYLTLAVVTILCVIIILREPTDRDDARHAYSRGTIQFGRWALAVSILFTFALPSLAANNLLPGQERRINYTGTTVDCLSPREPTFNKLRIHDHPDVLVWAKRMAGGMHASLGTQTTRRLIIIEQDGSFTDNFQTFNVSIYFGGDAKATGGSVYLVKNSTDHNDTPSYKTLKLLPLDNDPPLSRHVIEVAKPDEGDFMLLFLFVEAKSDQKAFPPEDYQFSLRR